MSTASEKRRFPRSKRAASCTSEPLSVWRQPPLKNVRQPLREATREKPQRWPGMIDESSPRA